jgi:hypothetical protein
MTRVRTGPQGERLQRQIQHRQWEPPQGRRGIS